MVVSARQWLLALVVVLGVLLIRHGSDGDAALVNWLSVLHLDKPHVTEALSMAGITDLVSLDESCCETVTGLTADEHALLTTVVHARQQLGRVSDPVLHTTTPAGYALIGLVFLVALCLCTFIFVCSLLRFIYAVHAMNQAFRRWNGYWNGQWSGLGRFFRHDLLKRVTRSYGWSSHTGHAL